MRPELRQAYPCLKREWVAHGRVRRMDGVKGIPDFLLTYDHWPRIAIFTEVKAVGSPRQMIGLDRSQAIRLQDLFCCGLLARVLVRVSERSWAACGGPFLDAKSNQINLHIDESWREGPRLTPDLLLGD